MEKLVNILKNDIEKDNFILGILSNLRKKSNEFSKVTIKPIILKDELLYQFEYTYPKKVTHVNLNAEKTIEQIQKLISETFKQINLFTVENDYQVIISKNNEAKIIKQRASKVKAKVSHNKKKNYIIEEDVPCDFLIKLQVMSEKGKVFAKSYDKFRQINKFLEIVSDCVPHLDKDRTINIIDFGCGKGYLTFAIYYYLSNKLNMNVKVIGVDLKKDVIELCNNISSELGYENLKFIYGDIKGVKEFEKIDVVVALHACDTATDDALGKAVDWDSQIILCAPCCQHELASKINNDVMPSMLKYGIIKEKMSALITDSLRANILEALGYSVQVMEFIDFEYTPKNILIRAIKSNKIDSGVLEQYIKLRDFWDVSPYIESILLEKLKKYYKISGDDLINFIK